jgi:hypothetical protein
VTGTGVFDGTRYSVSRMTLIHIFCQSSKKDLARENCLVTVKYNTATFTVYATSRQARILFNAASIIATFEHAKPFVLFLLTQRAVTPAARHTRR